MHSQEMMYMQIEENEEWLAGDFRFANHWYFDKLFYMAARLNQVGVKSFGDDYVQKVSISASCTGVSRKTKQLLVRMKRL